MPNRVYKFTDIFELQTFLNGGLLAGAIAGAQNGGSPAGIGTGLAGLVGATLKFTSPSAVTVTFVASSGAGGSADPGLPLAQRNPNPQVLTFKDIKSQIEAAIPAVSVQTFKGRLLFIEATPASGIALDNTGTANPIFGLDQDGTTTRLFYAPPPATDAPCWTWACTDNSGSHVIYTLEE